MSGKTIQWYDITPDGVMSLWKQRRLYAKHIAPNEWRLLNLLQSIRRDVDDLILSRQAEIWYENPFVTRWDYDNHEISPLFGYPDGCCLFIVHETLDLLEQVMWEESPFLESFINDWWILQKRWWYYTNPHGEKFLQNFIQIGNRILDVAYEEMNPNENEAVHIERVQDWRYRILWSIRNILQLNQNTPYTSDFMMVKYSSSNDSDTWPKWAYNAVG
jgi:hypothetical protein